MKKFLLLAATAMMTLGASAADWYLVGANYGWDDNEANALTATGTPNEYSIKVESLSGTVKIKPAGAGNWANSFGRDTQNNKLKEGVVYNAGNDTGDITVDGPIANATLTINTQAHTILVTGVAQENQYSEVYLVGDFDGTWDEGRTNYPLTLKAGSTTVYEGTYTLSATTSYFKMKAGTLVYGTGGKDIAVVLDTPYTASQSGNAFSIGAGTYTFSFTLEKNADTGVLVVTGDGGDTPDPVEPLPMEEWFVSIGGSFVEGGYNWNWGNGHNPIDGVANLGEYKIGTAEFEIKVWKGEAEGDFYFGTATPVIAAADKWVELSQGGGHMTVADADANSEYNVKFNVETNELCLTPYSAGINGVAADAAQAPAAYYNLQGIRVANPEAGVFIMVQDGKAVKVIK